MKAYALEVNEVIQQLGSDALRGLSTETVQIKLAKYGPNGTKLQTITQLTPLELPKPKKTPLWSMILEQFQDQLVIILLAAAGVSFALVWIDGGAGEGIAAFVEPLVIMIILIANAVVGVIQESNAERAIEVLQKTPLSLFNLS